MIENKRLFYIQTFLKGVAMGAANVIPGVSGGTIALITGVFERLIHAIKSFNVQALRLLLAGRFNALAIHVDLAFLIALFAGIATAIISLAKVLKFLFAFYPIYVWSFFFGLVLASIYFVGLTVKKWSPSAIISFVLGTLIAAAISVLTPVSENSAFFYLILCGIVAMCSMILPGLSGSFVLVLMGNYQLVMINGVSDMNLAVLFPVALGAAIGLIAFSHLLSWVLRTYPDQTIAILTGFITGSLGILWPWKTAVTQQFGDKIKTIGFTWHLPDMNTGLLIALFYIILGMASIVATELLAGNKKIPTPR